MAQWRTVGRGLAAVWCIAAAACDGGGGSGGGGDGDGGGGGGTISGVDLAPAFGSAQFASPVKLVQHPSNDDRWYVLEQGGRVRTFLGANPANITTAANVRDHDTGFVNSGEAGLLGMAFDPHFAQSGEIYLAYTRFAATRTAVLARWVSGDNGQTFVPDSPAVVLEFRHPDANHNGGDIMFGPRDQLLYYSMGDGGGADDPEDNGQDVNVLLGKILRIDPNTNQGNDTYAVPSGNRFAGNAHCNNQMFPANHPCPEIYAFGFRNPWRMNFDPTNGRLYVGDVGELQQEEIDLVVNGGNYGWDCVEGTAPHPTNAPCNFQDFTSPEVVHGRSEAQAITGGAVYRGTAIPSLRGFYVYGDFVTRLFFAFDTSVGDAPAVRLALPAKNVSAFGQGRDGEIYVVTFDSPSIYRLVPGSG